MKKRALFLPLFFQLSKVYFSDSSNKEQQYKKTIFYQLKNMGGIYIKFLQVLCISQKFTEGWGGPKEFEVFNQVSNEPLEISNYVNMDSFLYLKNTPFACGSFAQLYKGQLKTGEFVAVKILRPSVAKNLPSDLKKLKRIVKVIRHFLPKTFIDYRAAFNEFSNTCILEVDYEREISNMEYFAQLYKNHPCVVIPRVYKELCGRNVIVQQFIEGPTLADLISKVSANESLDSIVYQYTGSDVWKQIAIVGGEALRTAMTADYVFGDPHPGNIILLRENRVALIDFGIVAQRPTSQEAFYLWVKAYYDVLTGNLNYGRLFETTCMCFCPDLVNALRRCHTANSFFDSMAEAINQKMKTVFGHNEAAKSIAADGHLFVAFKDFIDSKNTLNIKIDTYNFQLLKAMQTFLSSVTTIDNRYGNHYFSKAMIDAMYYALQYCENNGIRHDIVDHTKYSINDSYELLLETLSSLANDEFLFQTISERVF